MRASVGHTQDVETRKSAEKDLVTFYDLALCTEMIDAAKSIGWDYPVAIQEHALPPALQGRDVLGMAETGSGKTGAFALPMLHHLLEQRTPFFGLVLEPTRELVFQVSEVFRALGQGIGLKVCAITGGVDEKSQISSLEKKPHIVVATTGRLKQILRERPQINMSSVRVLVFDEADRMLGSSFLEEVKAILSHIGTGHQTLLFSATMPDEVASLVKMSLTDPVKVELADRHQVAHTLTEYFAVAPTNRKEALLHVLLSENRNKTSIVFTNACKTAHVLATMLQTLRVSAVLYHGKMQQKDRHRAIEKFKAGGYSVLVTTNVASRGLDVPHVDCVINYDIPDECEEYIHRVGRAGRAARCGFAITMITMNDILQYGRLEKFLKKKLDRKQIDDSEIAKVMESVERAKKAGNESYKELAKKQKAKKR